MDIKAGSVNVSVYFYIVQDASATSPGEPVTGLLFSDIETGGSASYSRQGAARTDLTLITLASASAAHADGGFILVDDTNMPGLYRCDYPDAAFATGIDQVVLSIVVASANNAVAAPIFVQISDDIDQTGDNYVRLGAPSGANISADIADVPTVAEMNARTLASASYFDPAADTVANVTLVATTTTNTDMVGTNGANTVAPDNAGIAAILVDTGTTLDTKINNMQGATFDTATDSLEAIRNRGDIAWLTGAGGSSPTVAQIVDGVWDEAQSGHVTAGTFGKFLDVEVSSVSGGGGLTQQNVRDAMKLAPSVGSPAAGSVDIHLDDIIVDTGELQTDWTNGGRLDNILDSRMAESSINTTAGAVDVVTTNTDMRGTNGANTTAPDNASIAAILVDTGTTIPASISGVPNLVLAAGDIDGFTLEESQKLQTAALAGKLSGAATSVNIIRAADDSKARITATVDSDGNRTAITTDVTG